MNKSEAMPLGQVMHKGYELLSIKDEIKGIMTSKKDSRDKDAEIILMLYRYKRQWQLGASMDGIGIGMALSLIAFVLYSVLV